MYHEYMPINQGNNQFNILSTTFRRWGEGPPEAPSVGRSRAGVSRGLFVGRERVFLNPISLIF